jgi:opacity protein-like surface antigen
MLRKLFLLSSCLLIATASSGQIAPSAEGGGIAVSIGVAVSRFNPDYGCASASPFQCQGNLLLGPTIYAGLPHLFSHRLGLAGEMRFLHWRGPFAGLNEDSYLVGPQMRVWRFERIADLNLKFLIGSGHISLPKNHVGQGNYLAYAPAIGADFRASKRLSVRFEYEYQIWPGFEGTATSFTSGTGGITPNGFTLGVNYAILGRR